MSSSHTRWWTAGLAAAILLVGGRGSAAPTIQDVTTVDVTPFGFSAIWTVSEPSTPNIVIYADAAGTIEITDQFEITAFPLRGGDPSAADELAADAARSALRQASRSKGLMRLRVHGGQPNTSYYYRVTSEVGGTMGTFPIGAPLLVTTAGANSFVTGSHQALVSFSMPDPTGWIVTASSVETSYPVSAVVGDGAGSNQAFLNLAQLFAISGGNWQPVGTQPVTITLRKGFGTAESPNFDISFGADFLVGMAYLIDFDSPVGPFIALVEPSQDIYTRGESTILISWTDSFPAPDGEVSLYYDDNASGEDGTLIAGGLPEAPDGAADAFDWDTMGVTDGTYYVYARVSDASQTQTVYSSTTVTIDRGLADGDGDFMSDLWERFFLGDLSFTGIEDSDGDGSREREEFDRGTHPGVPDVRIRLAAGLNLISLPVDLDPPLSSADLLARFGGLAISISRVDTPSRLLETTELVGGVPQGPVFPIVSGEGYYVRLLGEYDAVWEGRTAARSRDYDPGVNLAGFPGLPIGYDAYQLLTDLGGPSVVSSISRFDPVTGRFETAGYDLDQLTGPNFVIERGPAYLIHMRSVATAFSP
ncbi:MAG: hypothetical protein ACE5FG_10470 [Myxococcota bacterium]